MSSKKKILFNTWAGAFFKQGGGEVQFLKSKEALEKRGHEVFLYNQWKPQSNIDLLHQFSMETGVEHVVNNYRERKIPVVLSTIMWTLLPKDSPEYKRVNDLFQSTDILLTNSDLESQRLSEAFKININKFHKTRNSISESYLRKGSQDLFYKKFKIEGPFVLSVANIDTRKNTMQLVRACKELNLKLVTIGYIKDQAYFDSFKDSHKDYIHLESIKDEELLKSAYASCALFALPSKCETPGIAALEAASQGARIVITSEGSTREYFQNHVTYVNPWVYESIRDGIKKGLEKPLSSELRNLVIQNYTWDKTAQDILEGYNKINF